ncbi:hypothetical protein B0H14DRAFT_3088112 [Mycena olivaceomarginata]|nr:hypothetical protein B0H14DRAFT_3088112 [Mycena olivaceomarginata]
MNTLISHPKRMILGQEAHTILCTTRLDCIFCPNDGHPPTFRCHCDPQQILLLDDCFRWVNTELYMAYCTKCTAEYYPDRITYHKTRRLEYDATYLWVSKHGIWMDRRVALAQENAILRFHSGWANFAEWLTHNLEEDFTVPAHSDAHTLVECVQETIGKDGGVVPGSIEHGCTQCTHLKRYTADLLAEGAVLNENTTGVIDAPELVQENAPSITSEEDLPPELRTLPKQQERVPGSACGYTRLAVMDGKTITHWICAVSTCNGPLMDYKNGCFCKDHHKMRSVCGIVACGHPVSKGTVTCNNESHREWHRKYLNHFWPQVKQLDLQPGPALHSELPELSGVAGDNVLHTFRAKTTYCLQTCYRSESSSQVLKIIDKIWESNPNSRPSFLAYDDACNLLRHIVTQNPNSPWVHGPKLIVDTWHYIGHQASDVLCRIWCNPAPANGSQPDLISVKLNGYEAQLQQMSDVNYDFSVHVLMMLYKELVDKRAEKKNEGLDEEFWDMVESTD